MLTQMRIPYIAILNFHKCASVADSLPYKTGPKIRWIVLIRKPYLLKIL